MLMISEIRTRVYTLVKKKKTHEYSMSILNNIFYTFLPFFSSHSYSYNIYYTSYVLPTFRMKTMRKHNIYILLLLNSIYLFFFTILHEIMRFGVCAYSRYNTNEGKNGPRVARKLVYLLFKTESTLY